MGAALAGEAPVEADLVIGVPDSGIPAAVGYAAGSGVPYGEGLAKNRYVGRTFISPSQMLRQQGIRLKLNPLKHAIRGQASRGRRRLDRARQHHEEARAAAARRRCRRGPHAHHVAAGEVAVLLRHRHRLPRPAHRVVQVGRGDPRAHRRGLARVSIAPRDGRSPPARPPSSSVSRASTASTRSRSRTRSRQASSPSRAAADGSAGDRSGLAIGRVGSCPAF